VSVASEGEGKGAQFTVRLPLAEGSLDTWTTRTNVAHPPRPRSAEKPRVVVVEDNIDSREMLCELLGLAGYECHTAANGGEALALIARVKPTVALVDIGLPGMDGYEVARRIREDPMHAGLRLIALTGYGQRNDRAASRAAGFDEHLVKPVAMADILGRLSEMHDPDGTGRVPSVTWTGQPRGSA
jgi:two-component system CheB/CheR fusion protein